MKKRLIINTLALLVVVGLAFVLDAFTNMYLSNILFYAAMIALTGSAAYLALARRDLRKAIVKKTKEEKKTYRMNFRSTEKQAFIMFAMAIILFVLSYNLR